MSRENLFDDIQLILPKFEELMSKGEDQKKVNLEERGLSIEAEIEELLKRGAYEDALSLIEMDMYFRSLLVKLRLRR